MKNKYGQEKGSNSSIKIKGDVSGAQIQQNVTHSSQTQVTNEEFDYNKVLDIIIEISNYESMFNEAYGENTLQIIELLNKAKQAVANKDKPSKIKGFLNVIKDISLKASSNLIVTGILGLLSKIDI